VVTVVDVPPLTTPERVNAEVVLVLVLVLVPVVLPDVEPVTGVVAEAVLV
jgi:hypothetical protein